MTKNSNYVKILIRYYSRALEEETVETMWATIVDERKGLYKVDNIPFYGPLLASDDIVFAEHDELEEMLTYRNTIEHSGNSIIQVVIMKDNVEINSIRKIFEDMGCLSEKANDGYFVMEVTFDKDYRPIKKKLKELKALGVIDYAEPCLSEKHQYELNF